MFKDIVKASRSYRGYDESYRFRREELEDFVDCARFAPSSVNAQPFRYYLAWEKEEVDRIQKLTNWARALPEMQLPHPGKCPTGFYHHLSGSESRSFYPEIPEGCWNRCTDHASRSS